MENAELSNLSGKQLFGRSRRLILFFSAAALAIILVVAGVLAYAYYEVYTPVNKNNTETVEFVEPQVPQYLHPLYGVYLGMKILHP